MTGPAPAHSGFGTDIADESYIAVERAELAPLVADAVNWGLWWPDLDLTISRDRGAEGQKWAVRGALTGSMEIWLEPAGRGTVVHWFLRADPAASATAGRVRRDRNRRVLAWKAHMFALKDQVEGSRNRRKLPTSRE